MSANVSDPFLKLRADFLNFRRGLVPFRYLGLPVGADPSRMSTWEPMLTVLRKTLNYWGNMCVSLGGRVVFLNSVLNVSSFLSII